MEIKEGKITTITIPKSKFKTWHENVIIKKLDNTNFCYIKSSNILKTIWCTLIINIKGSITVRR